WSARSSTRLSLALTSEFVQMRRKQQVQGWQKSPLMNNDTELQDIRRVAGDAVDLPVRPEDAAEPLFRVRQRRTHRSARGRSRRRIDHQNVRGDVRDSVDSPVRSEHAAAPLVRARQRHSKRRARYHYRHATNTR